VTTASGPAEAVRLRSPGDVVRAVSTLLGFHPVESVVIVGLQAGHPPRRVGPVLRADLPGTAEDSVAWAAQLISAVPTHPHLAAVVVITLAERVPGHVWPLLRAGFAYLDLPLQAGIHAESTQPGAAWQCLCDDPACSAAGVLGSETTALETHAVVAGQVRYATRAHWVAAGRPGHPNDTDPNNTGPAARRTR